MRKYRVTTVVILLILLVSIPTFADKTINEDIVYISSPYEVLTFKLSEGTEHLEGALRDSTGEWAGEALYLEKTNEVVILPYNEYEELEEYELELYLDIPISGGSNTRYSQVIVYDSEKPTSTDLDIIEEDQVENVSTLMDFDDLTSLEKETYYFSKAVLNREKTYEFKNILSAEEIDVLFDSIEQQSNILRTLTNESYDFDYELINNVWHYVRFNNLTYDDTLLDYSALDSEYKTIFNSLDLNNKTNKEKSLEIALYLIKKFDYEDNYNDQVGLYGQSFYSILKDSTVCAGYANSYQYLLNLAGIRSDIVSVDVVESDGSRISHVFNKVYFSEDDISYTDLTFMDSDNEDNFKYDYFDYDDIGYTQNDTREIKGIRISITPYSIEE